VLYAVVFLLVSSFSYSGDFSSNLETYTSGEENVGGKDFIFSRVASDKYKYRVELAYVYKDSSPKTLLFDIPEKGFGDKADGEIVVYASYRDGEVVELPMFLGLHATGQHVSGPENKFIWLAVEFNHLLGAVSNSLNFVRADVRVASKMRSSSDRLNYLMSLPRVDLPVPILSEESGIFYLPVQIGKEIINYDKGELSIKVRVKRIKI